MGTVHDIPPPAWVCPYGCGCSVRVVAKAPTRGGCCPLCHGALTDEALEAAAQRTAETRKAAFLEAAEVVMSHIKVWERRQKDNPPGHKFHLTMEGASKLALMDVLQPIRVKAEEATKGSE